MINVNFRYTSVADLREGPRGARPPLFLDQTEDQRAEKKILGEAAPSYLRIWMTAPPYLKVLDFSIGCYVCLLI